MSNSIKLPLVKLSYSGRSQIADADSILATLSEMLEDLDDGEVVSLKRVDLTTAQYEALPEFEGW